jgi:hypothetical protein
MYHIGDIHILSYHPWKVENNRLLSGQPDETVLFHGWVDIEDTSHSWETLDAAIVGCISYRVEGPNGKAGEYFMRMLKQ